MEHVDPVMTVLGRGRAAILHEIDFEVQRSAMHGTRFASLHEAWGVMFEELDEIWDITRMKRRDRDPAHIRKELIQLAAMAVKSIDSMDNFVGGNV